MLAWNVYCLNFNGHRIETHNIFDHLGFYEDCRKAAKKYAKDPEGFSAEIKTSLMYWYWSKCEWEVIIGAWPSGDLAPEIKVDVYGQVMLNWDHFIEWLWEHRRELKKRKEDAV